MLNQIAIPIKTLKTENPRPFLSRGLAAIAVVLLSIGGLLSLRDSGHTQPQPLMAAVEEDRSESASTPQYLSKRIADIEPIVDRVLADNPETEGQAPSEFGEFHAADWRLLKLMIPKPDGEWLKVTLARPLTWIAETERDKDGRLWLEFEELDIANWADVLTIEPCPEAAVGEGRLVTGKFEHSSAEVIELRIDGLSEPIGTTSNHPFWSEDQQEFVQAGSLSVGEHLRLENGDNTTVTAINARAGTMPVFNLEVDGEHVYHVSEAGVLVHNTADYIPSKPIRIGPRWKARDVLHPSMRAGCDKVAAQIQNIIGGNRIHIRPKEGGFLGGMRRSGSEPFKYPHWNEHYAVVRDGRVYDAFTGAKGMPIDDYMRCWEDFDRIDFGI